MSLQSPDEKATNLFFSLNNTATGCPSPLEVTEATRCICRPFAGVPPKGIRFIPARACGFITWCGLLFPHLIHEWTGTGFGCIRVSPGYFTFWDESLQVGTAICEVTDCAGP